MSWIRNKLNRLAGPDGLTAILLFGIFLRVVVFVFLDPANNDDHLAYVRYIHQHHALPVSGQLYQSNHPPLYYLLASLVFPWGAKAVQALSLIFSIGTLCVLYLLVRKPVFPGTGPVKQFCLLFACCLPQFVMFGNYVSNDSLSFLIGALIFLQVYRLLMDGSRRNQFLLAAALGLGTATKGTFLLFFPVLLALVVLVNAGRGVSWRRCAEAALVFIAIVALLGSHKAVNNLIHFHRPVVIIDKDPGWVNYQSPTYAGMKSFYDVDIAKLVRSPVLSDDTRHSYPLMLYGSFWYQYLSESGFKGNLTRASLLGSLIYVLALLPTALLLLGLWKSFPSLKMLFTPRSARPVYPAFCLLLLFSNLFVIVALALKYDVYSAFQGRFLFPAFFAFLFLLAAGMDHLRERRPRWLKVVFPWLACLYSCFIVYFCIEIYMKAL